MQQFSKLFQKSFPCNGRLISSPGAHLMAQRRHSIMDDEDEDEDIKRKKKELNGIVEDLEKDKEEEEAPKTRWTETKGAVHEWASDASVHGIPHMARATTCLAVMIWGVILVFCAVGFVYLFADTLGQFLAYDKSVQLNLYSETGNFPSVTFCNINPYKLSQIQTVPSLNALLSVYNYALNGTLT